jgi:hypothetical protein
MLRARTLARRLLLPWLALFAMSASPVLAGLTLTSTVTPSFGTVLSGASGRQFVLNTDDTITGASAADYVSGAAAAQLIVADDLAPAALVILVDNIGTLGGLTVAEATCRYAGGAQLPCDGAGLVVTSQSSATLRVGLDVSTSTTHSGGDSASVSLDVSVVYQ